MNEHARKKVAGRSGLSDKPLDDGRRSIQCCNRRGCAARYGPMDEVKSSRTALPPAIITKRKVPVRSSGANGQWNAPPLGGGTGKKKAEQEPRAGRGKTTNDRRAAASRHSIRQSGTSNGLRRLRCSSVSDVILPGCADSGRRKTDEPFSSSSRCIAGKKASHPDGLPRSSVLERRPPRSTPKVRTASSSAYGAARFSGEPGIVLPLPPPPQGRVSLSGSRLIDAVAEMLLALERLQEEEELTRERLAVIRSALRISFPDRHRDWRLDIDHMTYEELLELEEKMGTVSTAVPEDELHACVKSSLFRPISGLPGLDSDEAKCSICQEEYEVREEVGKLSCGHRYHMECIRQWLGQKSWCPICKSSVGQRSHVR